MRCARSNEILQAVARRCDTGSRERLARLPIHLVTQVGGLRVGIVHGDATSLAGWRFAREELDDPARRAWLAEHPHGVAHRSVRFDPHLSGGAARLRVAGRPADRHQQRCRRNAQFRRLHIRRGDAHRGDALAASAAVRTSAATAFTSTPCRELRQRRIPRAVSRIAGRRARRLHRLLPRTALLHGPNYTVATAAGQPDRTDVAPLHHHPGAERSGRHRRDAGGAAAVSRARRRGDRGRRRQQRRHASNSRAPSPTAFSRTARPRRADECGRRSRLGRRAAVSARRHHRCRPTPTDWCSTVCRAPAAALGPLRRRDRGAQHPLLRVVAGMMNWRSQITGIATGDQAMFVTREAFAAAGGFPDIAADGGHRALEAAQADRPSALPRRAGAHLRPPLGPARRDPHHPADVAAAICLLASAPTRRRWHCATAIGRPNEPERGLIRGRYCRSVSLPNILEAPVLHDGVDFAGINPSIKPPKDFIIFEAMELPALLRVAPANTIRGRR